MVAPDEGQAIKIAYNPGDRMDPGAAVIELYSDKRADRLRQLTSDLLKQRGVIDAISSESGSATPSDGQQNTNIQKATARAANQHEQRRDEREAGRCRRTDLCRRGEEWSEHRPCGRQAEDPPDPFDRLLKLSERRHLSSPG